MAAHEELPITEALKDYFEQLKNRLPRPMATKESDDTPKPTIRIDGDNFVVTTPEGKVHTAGIGEVISASAPRRLNGGGPSSQLSARTTNPGCPRANSGRLGNFCRLRQPVSDRRDRRP